MRENTWNRVEQIFADALALSPGDREPFVRAAADGDEQTCRAVLDLLAAHSEMGGFLEAPLIDFSRETYGQYRVIRELGRGGMSIVYLGERVDGTFRREVAIKVILVQARQPSQEGVADPETRILAGLQHPNIARLLDAGVSTHGFRYLIMERVEGVPCTTFAESLHQRDKLKLFLQVCAGVHYANRSLIVHRDLKPANILVDSTGTVKLLDFGIAKLLSADSSLEQTSGAPAYTINYASPEQILGKPVTTASDVYSLGVLLCELLTGKRPRDLEATPFADVIQLVSQTEVPPLDLEGDLGRIVQKALRRDPAERYEGAGALAGDLERFLSGLPIDARPPSWSYRAGKFLSRHRFAVAAGSAAAALLLASTGVAIWEGRLASRRFSEVRSLATTVLFDLHDKVQPLRGSLKARKLIVDRSLQYLDALARDPGVSDEVQLDVARGYLRLADIQGTNNARPSVGESEQALARAAQGLTVVRRVIARSPENQAATLVLLDALLKVAEGHSTLDRYERALPEAASAADLATRLYKNNPTDREARDRLAAVLMTYGDVASLNGDQAKAAQLFKQVVDMRRQLVAESPLDDGQRRDLSHALNYWASELTRMKRTAEADPLAMEAYRTSKDLFEKNGKSYRALHGSNVGLLATLKGDSGDFASQVPMFLEQLRLRREIAADDPRDAVTATRVAATLDRLCYAHTKLKQYQAAIRYCGESLQALRSLKSSNPDNMYTNRELLFVIGDFAKVQNLAGNLAHSCELATEGLDLHAQRFATVKEMAVHGASLRKIVSGCAKR